VTISRDRSNLTIIILNVFDFESFSRVYSVQVVVQDLLLAVLSAEHDYFSSVDNGSHGVSCGEIVSFL